MEPEKNLRRHCEIRQHNTSDTNVVIYTDLLIIPVLDLCKYQCLQSVVAMRVRYRVSVVDYVRSVQGTVINSGDQLLITSGVANKV